MSSIEWLAPLPALADARKETDAESRRQALLAAAPIVRAALLEQGPVRALHSCPLVTLPYPALYAFSGAARSPAPFVQMTNRMLIVELECSAGRKRLLFNPSDVDGNAATPYFARLRTRYGNVGASVMSKRHGDVATHLAARGLAPGDIDYIAFDHLHTQDLRRWLVGTKDQPAFFPRAQLLVHSAEWRTANEPHPMQAAWYLPEGVRDVPAERLCFVDHDAWLGRGVALVQTPGHTAGNMSLAVVTDRAVYVVSENGVSVDNYHPNVSRIPGLRAHAEQLGLEVLLNGNTRESSSEQYSSMLLERAIAGPAANDARFSNVFPSSQLVGRWIAPGLAPTFAHEDVEFRQAE